MVKIEQKCQVCHHTQYWFSQPFVGGKPAGNLLQSAGILLSGSIPTKVLRMYKLMNVPSISMSTYTNHQRHYLYPSISHVWHNYQQDYIDDAVASGRSVSLAGDGRCDSPGHCAKYGSFNVLDLQENAVVDVQLVQVKLCKHVYLQIVTCSSPELKAQVKFSDCKLSSVCMYVHNFLWNIRETKLF
jgi:solute carrier family 8 (sodium/calcium exchanger)